MENFERFYRAAASSAFSSADWLVAHIFTDHAPQLAIAGVVASVLAVAGGRLKKFNHPDRPLVSPVARKLGAIASWVGWLSVTLLLALLVALPGLHWVGSSAWGSVKHVDAWSIFEQVWTRAWPWLKIPTLSLVGGLVTGTLAGLFLAYRTIPLMERGAGLRDVRDVERSFRRMRQFSPLNFVNLKKGIFVGLEDGKRPVYVPNNQFCETHTQVVGASGSGKGIALGLLGYQFTLAGEALVCFDPKGDRRLPAVLAAAVKRAGVGFHNVDLNPTAPPQFNLLAGASAHEIEELLVGGLGLQPSDGEGNYYRGVDQDAAETVARRAAETRNPSLATLVEIAQADTEICKADNFVRRLRQVAQLPAAHTSHDIDLAGILKRGEVLYVRGSTDNHRVKTLQTMLLIRMLQIVKTDVVKRKVALMLDEFKHLLCPVSLDALGVVRELGCHAILAHQSMGDLGSCPGLRREDVEPRVADNTTLKLVYRLNDAKASADFATRSGYQRTHAERVGAVDDEGQDQRGWGEVQQTRMPSDLFTHLHRPSDGSEVVAAGVLFGCGAARLLAVSPICVGGDVPAVRVAPTSTVVKPVKPEAQI